ncbi:MAG: hypothetical protein WC052_05255 [Patescibacteria group bacterium]
MFYIKDLESESSNDIGRVESLLPYQQTNEAGELVFLERYEASTREAWEAVQSDDVKEIIASGGYSDEADAEEPAPEEPSPEKDAEAAPQDQEAADAAAM